MKVNFPDDMKEIFEEFLVEADEILEELQNDLVELEQNPEDKDLLNKIFRGMHTLKGGAGFLGLTSIVELAHRVEDIFNKLRNNELKVTPELMDIVFAAVDKLVEAINMLKEKGEIPDLEDIKELLKKLDAAKEGRLTNHEESSQNLSSQQIPEEYKDVIEWILKYPGKTLEEILDELILLPPEERPTEIIEKLDKLISQGKDLKDILPPDLYKKHFAKSSDNKEEKTTEENKVSQTTTESSKSASVSTKEKTSSQQTSKTPSKENSKHTTGTASKKKEEKKKETEVIRIDVERVETLMNLVGELVLDRNRIVKLVGELEKEFRDHEIIEQLSETVTSMDRTVSDLQIAVMKLRMQPVKRVFSKFPRIVRDLARKLGKKVQLIIEGEDTEIDRSILEKIEEPLIHLVRNALDHGIEPPEERIKKGKPEVGTIRLFAYHEGDHIVIGICDDGRGIDVEKVKEKAIRKGLITPEQAAQMSDKEALELIFMPGFSTKDEASELSGRGVGMDVVMTIVHAFRGTVEIESEKDKGTCIYMKLPLTVAIIGTLMAKGEIEIEPTTAYVDNPNLCFGCRICKDVCDFNAI
ncbi:MAG TPA: chemotaxis protein CheA, partial [Aquificae bacterium]|nr:chemotaxis protein CheA [Aquificota bacterium]